jgi:hypothetical protein
MNRIFSLCGLFAGLLFVVGLPQVGAQSGPGSISGNIFEDADQDGKAEEGEGGSEEQVVKLYRLLDNGERELVGEVTTGADGSYSFSNLPLGSYVVVFEFATGVTVESATPIILTESNPSVVQPPVPQLSPGFTSVYSPVGLGLRNPANTQGQEVSRFAP